MLGGARKRSLVASKRGHCKPAPARVCCRAQPPPLAPPAARPPRFVLQDGLTSPCSGCTGTSGCASCLAGSFSTPDSYVQKLYKMTRLPTLCYNCGWCSSGACSATGCTACDLDTASSTAWPMVLLPGPALGDVDRGVCMLDYCNGMELPYNLRLWR